MRGMFVVVAFACAAACAAEELTVREVIVAHRAGAPADGILRLVRESPEVAVLAAPDLDRLRAAGVLEVVILAMAARHALPPPTPAEAKPDDPTLGEVVRLVGAGLSERLVCEQIRQSGGRHRLSANDLVYLKQHDVPETVIAALMETAAIPSATPVPTPAPTPTPAVAPVVPVIATPTPLPTTAPPVALAFEPLLRMAGTFRKAQAGRLVLTAHDLEWSDLLEPTQVGRIPTASLKTVWLSVTRRAQGPPLTELRVRTSAGDDLTFRDVDPQAGNGGNVESLYRAIRERYPQVVLSEKPAR